MNLQQSETGTRQRFESTKEKSLVHTSNDAAIIVKDNLVRRNNERAVILS